jgi:hypothetical protein
LSARAAPMIGAVLVLALFGAGTSHALSLRGSAAELFLEDASKKQKVDAREFGTRLRVENSGAGKVRVEIKASPPMPSGLKDGYEPWPHMDLVRVRSSRTALLPGEGTDVDIEAGRPKESVLRGLYQFDVVETGRDSGGGQLTLKTKILLSAGIRTAKSADEPAGGWVKRPGFTLSPNSASIDAAATGEASVKIVNAGEEDLKVTLTPARDWSEDVTLGEGYESAPNPGWLSAQPEMLALKAGSIGSVRLKVDMPKQGRYAGRHMAFVVAVDAEGGGKRSRRYFVLHVNTEHLEEEKRVR